MLTNLFFEALINSHERLSKVACAVSRAGNYSDLPRHQTEAVLTFCLQNMGVRAEPMQYLDDEFA
jgi:hypothetical protein